MRRKSARSLFSLGLVLGANTVALAATEDFSTFVDDAGPDARGQNTRREDNRVDADADVEAPSNYGFSPTSFVNTYGGSGTGTGEMGGQFYNPLDDDGGSDLGTAGYYGLNTGTFAFTRATSTFNQELFRGKGQVVGKDVDPGDSNATRARIWIGFFNSAESGVEDESKPGDFYGIRIDGPTNSSPTGINSVQLEDPGNNVGTGAASTPDNVTVNFEFWLVRNADGGDADGNGFIGGTEVADGIVNDGATLFGKFGTSSVVSNPVSEAQILASGTNTFGLSQGSRQGGLSTVFIDNLTFDDALTRYWDTNGATTGAGTSPSGDWDGVTTNFNVRSSGEGAVGTGPNIMQQVNFSAGNDASGPYTVTLIGTRMAGGVSVSEGDVTLAGGTLVTPSLNVSGDSTLIINSQLNGGLDGSLVKAGSGVATLGAASARTGATTVDAGTLVLGHADAIKASSGLTVNSAIARISPSLTQAVTVKTVATTGTGAIDMTSGSMVVKNSDLATVSGMIASAVGENLTWDGPGINSSVATNDPNGITAIGVATYADYIGGGNTDFQGITDLDADDVLVRVTYLGDSDMNGDTNLDDYPLFIYGLEDPEAPQTWYYGDYNYSGEVNIDDFPLFIAGLENDPIQTAALVDLIEMSSISPDNKSAMLGMLSAVPEPGSLGVLGVAACGLAARRRRV